MVTSTPSAGVDGKGLWGSADWAALPSSRRWLETRIGGLLATGRRCDHFPIENIAFISEEIKVIEEGKPRKTTTADKVIEIIAERAGFREETVKREESLIDGEFGYDSVDLVEIVISLEEAFDIEIPDEEAMKLDTVGKVIDYIERRINERKT